MATWRKVDREDNFTGQVKSYHLDGKSIAVYKLADGYHAMDDRCSHEEATLSEGEISDGEVECPLHGARFDIRTGKNLSLPAVIPVKSYPVEVKNGEILILL